MSVQIAGRSSVNMLSGPIIPALLRISVPIMVMNVVQSMFNVVDMTVLENFGTAGDDAVGAVGACGTLISLITGLLIGISSGSNVVVSRYIGQKDNERVERSIGCAVLVSLIGGILLSVIGVSFAEVFLVWMNCPVELLPYSALYFRLYFLGIPVLMLYNFLAAILRSSGDSTRPMIFLTVGGVIKVALTFFFTAVLDAGVVGVAVATIISWVISATLATFTLLRGTGVVRLKLSRLRIYRRELSEILYIGVPAGLQQALYSVANVIITTTVNGFGKEATTGISIANTFDGILYQISVAPSLAVMPFVSQNVGAGNIKRATRGVWSGILITTTLGAIFGGLSAIFSAELSSLMTSNPAVIAYSQQKMIIISSTYFICGINEIMGAALKGMGKPIVPTMATLVFMCLIRFPWVFFVFPLWQNMTFLYMIWPIGWVLSIITILIFYFPTVKKLEKLEESRA